MCDSKYDTKTVVMFCMSTNVFSGWCQVAPRIVPVTSTVKADCPGFTSRRGHAVFSLPAASVYRAALT